MRRVRDGAEMLCDTVTGMVTFLSGSRARNAELMGR